MASILPNSATGASQGASTENQSSTQFLLKTFKVNYDNKYTVRHVTGDNQDGSLVITNYICRKVGQMVFKKTEILIGHQLITLEDSYHFQDLLHAPKDPISKPEMEIETNASVSDQKPKEVDEASEEEQGEKRDRKNVVKNIVKAFESWIREELTLEKSKESILPLQNCRKALERMIAKIKFNNRLINSVLNNPNLTVLFERFLKEEALIWLENSKIKDRTSHKQAIDAYLISCASSKPVVCKVQQDNETL